MNTCYPYINHQIGAAYLNMRMALIALRHPQLDIIFTNETQVDGIHLSLEDGLAVDEEVDEVMCEGQGHFVPFVVR